MKENLNSDTIEKIFDEHISVIKESKSSVVAKIDAAVDLVSKSLTSKGTIFWCGNGGSAADSQHIAAEFVGRFKKNRRPLKSIALSTDTSVITCISNDFSYEEIFSRQLEAMGNKDDVLVAITTSGNSENMIKVLLQAKKIGIKTIGLLGKDGGKCKNIIDLPIIVPSYSTARIQETHILIEHLLCELVENKLGFN